MFRLRFLMLSMIIFLVFGALGCEQASKLFGTQVTAEDGLNLMLKAEAFYPTAQQAVGEYLDKNPQAMTPEDQEKLKAANAAFVAAYTASKRSIQDIIAVKKGQTVTIQDIGSELVIFAGKYMEFKQAFKTLTGGKVLVTFPDEVGAPATKDVNELVKELTPPTPPDAATPANVAPS